MATLVYRSEAHTWINKVMFESKFILEVITYGSAEAAKNKNPIGQLTKASAESIENIKKHINDPMKGFIYISFPAINIVEDSLAEDPYQAFEKLKKCFKIDENFHFHVMDSKEV